MSSPSHTGSPNRLIHETSPYLLQHAYNPVDWYPWGPEALRAAKETNRPILLSIGYSSCHWCHVMERESFEQEAIAAIMNREFICIKVDREERPDLDEIYMQATVAMNHGQGGWPMTVFLTPDQEPFFAGTYFPPEDRWGRPGFGSLLKKIADVWKNNQAGIQAQAQDMAARLKGAGRIASPMSVSDTVLDEAVAQFKEDFDTTHGGFGTAPKFPPAAGLSLLLRCHRRSGEAQTLTMVTKTLDMMAAGGIYDHIGGGFARYSTDARWLVPHFEKMLYDNALLSRVYLDAWLATGKPFYREIAVETLEYVRREMTDPGGGFYSSQDADSEGVEGRFFVWTPREIEALLGAEEAALFCGYFDVTEHGNFEEANILHVEAELPAAAARMGVAPARLAEVVARGKRVLFEARERRIKPGRDEKILTAWNGLMLRSFAEAARVLDREDYLQVALRNAGFLLSALRRDGRLLRTHKAGESRLNAYQEDYAYVIDGLLALYEATFDPRWFAEARALTETMIEQFWDAEAGGFFFTSGDHESLITRTRDFYDNATPAGNSVAAHLLLRLALWTGEDRYRDMAERILLLMQSALQRMPSGFGHLLCALDLYLAAPHEIAIVGDPQAPATRALLDAVFQRYLPNRVVALAAPGQGSTGIPLLDGRVAVEERATAYLCRRFVCRAPVTDAAELAAQLD